MFLFMEATNYMKSGQHKVLLLVNLGIMCLLLIPNINAIILPIPLPLEDTETKDLYLLRVEHYLELEATENTDTFHVQYAFPPMYKYQVPIVLTFFNDSTTKLMEYRIQDDTYAPNRIVNFTISSMQADEHALIHFTIWMLIEAHDFSDLPDDVDIPSSPNENPEDTIHWLSSSEMVQSKRVRIRVRANQLEGNNDDVVSYAQNVSYFIKNHRYGFFLFQLFTRMFFKQDAMATLRFNGENVGRSHLACALLRSQNIPARVILVNNDQGFWTQMHYMVEYYVPDYGWVLLDSTKGETPYSTQRQIINRICSIEDEDDTKHDYIYRFMRGEERWIWIDTETVQPYYIDCDEGSKSQMFTETIVSAQPFAADYSFFRTQNVYSQYEKFLGSDLSSTDQQHVEQAIHFQTQACLKLVDTGDLNEYIFYIEKAYDEYKAITL